ncbi:hypothetical protein P43SY_008807 [Pythium insidiosum]|uniref:Ryanodine-inositol 1,4,5-triphosphate receptor Ca2 channel (RIR-CaC) family protein n=1 Tax=Pythium insidiosum TaxID=114742 RepID=A0AAD5LN67_PYTIN|nr:hypothetical protein P43SY_008807 [Pythium insidiosum]
MEDARTSSSSAPPSSLPTAASAMATVAAAAAAVSTTSRQSVSASGSAPRGRAVRLSDSEYDKATGGGSLCARLLPRWCGRRERSLSAGSGVDMQRLSTSQAPKTAEQLLAENQLKKQIEKYSTMRVHMKRVQLCLEQEKRNKFYKELVVYMVFLVLVLSSLLQLPIHFPYEQNAALDDLFFDEEFRNISIRKSFHDVMVEDELWQWVQGPFLEGFYELPIRNTRRLGSALFRTGRVKGDLCRRTEGRSNFVLFVDELCYPVFSLHNEDRAPYGDAQVTQTLGQQYEWSKGLGTLLRSQTFKPGLFNLELDYGSGGYAVYLPRDNATSARAIVQELQRSFLTDGARYLSVSFAFYNARSNIFSAIVALFEMSDTDYMEVTARVKSFELLPSLRDSAFFWDNVFVFVLAVATVWLLYREASDLREFGMLKYVHSFWNVLDMLQLVLLIVFLVKWTEYVVQCEQIRDDLLDVAARDCASLAPADQAEARACFVDIEPLAWQFLSMTNYAAGLALVSVSIVFKYLRLNTRLNLLWRTLRFAAKDLLAFVVIFFIIFIAFAIMGFLTFGSKVRQYHSLSVSLTSCFQMLLGAFDYNVIYEANPAMAGLFFFSFMISVYLICVNMFIAIMSEYYSLAQDEKKRHEENKRQLISVPSRRKKKAGDLAGAGDADDDDDDDDDDCFADSLSFNDVEYDLAKQFQSYVRGLHVRVRLPPKKDGPTIYSTGNVELVGYQRVLLVDYNYLLAERKRLRTKFRAAVHVVTTMTYILRRWRPDFKLDPGPRVLITDHNRGRNRSPSASSASSSFFGDMPEFPVTYVPIASPRANVAELLKSLRKGMLIEVDDGSLTKDQITLEVLGDQQAYIPPRSKRLEAATPSGTRSAHGRALSEDGGSDAAPGSPLGPLQVRINTVPTESHAAPERPEFGLRHTHDGIGGASHIRCCRVLYHGETMLDGKETCLFPRRVWLSYFVRHVLWGSIAKLWSCRQKRKKVNRLITDAEVDKLITAHFMAPGRGISCRFDELVRNFRMLIAKKVHKKHWRIPNLEERIFVEVITFLERFPSALSPLDKRELEGYKYTPQPVDTKRVRLPGAVHLLAELLAQNAHEVWAVGRISQGWRWGPQRDNDKLLHPDLLPYEALTEETKQYDRDTSIEALKVITALGYILEQSSEAEDVELEFGVAASEPGGTYEPKPIPTDSVKVPPELRSLIELLAENTHEVWARMRMEQGWKYGPRRDDAKREHNGLVPYIYLTQEEKQMDRNTAMQTVKVILRCGYSFVHRDKLHSGASRKRQSDKFKAFGRNENPEAKNVGDAVSLARSTARAKRAFMKRSSGRRGITSGSSAVSSQSSNVSSGGLASQLEASTSSADSAGLESLLERADSTLSTTSLPARAGSHAALTESTAARALVHSETAPAELLAAAAQGDPERPGSIALV